MQQHWRHTRVKPAMTKNRSVVYKHRGDAVDLDVEIARHAGTLMKIRAGGFFGK